MWIDLKGSGFLMSTENQTSSKMNGTNIYGDRNQYSYEQDDDDDDFPIIEVDAR